MPRRIFFKGDGIYTDSLVVGNHGNTELFVRGSFVIHGLIHCPKYRLILNIAGTGELKLHGICKQIEIKKIKGDCKLYLEELTTSSIMYYGQHRVISPGDLKTVPMIIDCE
jgi:hypothetical protein